MLANLLMNSLVVVSLADYSVEWTEEKSITTTQLSLFIPLQGGGGMTRI